MEACTILLVDDDPVVRTLLYKRLLNNGYAVTIAANGVEAMEILNKLHFDIIISDLIMPGGIDGINLLQKVKEQWSSTDVILITGHSSIGKAVEAMKKGATDYLEKPINIDELFLRLDKINQIQSLVKNAGDLREAIDTTILSAADTIQNLEITAFDQRRIIEQIDSIVCNEDYSDHEKILLISKLLES